MVSGQDRRWGWGDLLLWGTIGFAMLMGLTLAIIFQDVIRIISGESLIP